MVRLLVLGIVAVMAPVLGFALEYQLPALAAGSESRLGPACTSANAAPLLANSRTMQDYTAEQIKDDPITYRETFATNNAFVTLESRGCTDAVLNIKIDYSGWKRPPEPANMLSFGSSVLNRMRFDKDSIFPAKLPARLSDRLQEMQQAGTSRKVFCLNPSSSGGGCMSDVAVNVRSLTLELNYIDRR